MNDPGGNSDDLFGNSVAIYGNTAVIGASQTNSSTAFSSGAAYIYVRGTSGWPTKPAAKLLDPSASGGSTFGNSVAIDRGTIVIGAQFTNGAATTAQGAAYIYVKGTKGWPTKPTVTLTDPTATSDDEFGSSVSIDGSTIVVGAAGTNTFTGAAYMFTKGSNGHWNTTPAATLVDPAATQYDAFGSSVSVDGSTVAIGTVNGSAAYIYVKGTAGWPAFPTTSLADPQGGGTCFGCAVATEGDATVLVGARFGSAVYVYTRGSSGWPANPNTTLSDPGAGGNNDFGVAVAVDGPKLAVGSDSGPAAPGGGPIQYEGAAYFYTEGTTGWPTTPTTSVQDPGGTSGDFFGASVAVSGTVAVVGAQGCSPGCPGTTHPGSAYIFSV